MNLQEIKTSLNKNSLWFRVGVVLTAMLFVTLLFSLLVGIMLAYPWIVIWSVNTLFTTAQIPYNFWSVIAFYILNIYMYMILKRQEVEYL